MVSADGEWTAHMTTERTGRRGIGRPAAVAAVIAVGVTAAGVALGHSAGAEPGTVAKYPAGASATRFTGFAFDACDAPSRETMQAWRSSPFGAIGIYTSGDLRACDQKELTAAWVDDVSDMGWKLIPIDVGLQAPCADNRSLDRMSRTASKARKQGATAATGAVAAAGQLGILPGSALYSDIESFSSRDVKCAESVRAYLSGWTKTLHDLGYLAGAYGNLASAVRSQSNSYTSTEHARLDAVWSAEWNGDPDTADWSGVVDTHWPAHQRIKQYRGDHHETHGGKTINIDSNIVDAPVATIARTHTLTMPSNARPAPDPAAHPGPPLLAGTKVELVCRTHVVVGPWNKLADGTYLHAAVTPSATPDSLPVCTTPFQLAEGPANTRSGPDRDAPMTDSIDAGSLLWTTCETPGITLGKPGYWQLLDTGQWLSSPLTTKPDPYEHHQAIALCKPATPAPS